MSSQSSIDHSPLTARQAEAGGYAWYSAQLYFHLSADRLDPQAPYPSTHAKGGQMKQLSVTLAKAPPNRALLYYQVRVVRQHCHSRPVKKITERCFGVRRHLSDWTSSSSARYCKAP